MPLLASLSPCINETSGTISRRGVFRFLCLSVATLSIVSLILLSDAGNIRCGVFLVLSPPLGKRNKQRMVRDVFQISGTLRLSASGVVEAVQLNALHPLARGVADGLAGLLCPAPVTVTTGAVEDAWRQACSRISHQKAIVSVICAKFRPPQQ